MASTIQSIEAEGFKIRVYSAAGTHLQLLLATEDNAWTANHDILALIYCDDGCGQV